MTKRQESLVPDGLGVRIPGFHPGGPGSIPGLGVFFFLCLSNVRECSRLTHD